MKMSNISIIMSKRITFMPTKFIVKIHDSSARYAYCVYSVFEYEDHTCSEDTRIFESDDRDEFVSFLKNLNIQQKHVDERKDHFPMLSAITSVGTVELGDNAYHKDGNNYIGGRVLEITPNSMSTVDDPVLLTDGYLHKYILASEVDLIIPCANTILRKTVCPR